MSTERLEARVKELEERVRSLQRLQDIEDINRLQRAYGYYLVNWLHQELIDCFSTSPKTTLEWPQGTFIGSDAPRRFFGNINKKKDPEFLHQMMQISGIVDIDPDGNTGKEGGGDLVPWPFPPAPWKYPEEKEWTSQSVVESMKWNTLAKTVYGKY